MKKRGDYDYIRKIVNEVILEYKNNLKNNGEEDSIPMPAGVNLSFVAPFEA